jgi:hypothetical protein
MSLCRTVLVCVAVLSGAAAVTAAAARARGAAALPPARIPDCVGVNLHFLTPQPGEMEMIADAGFRVIRTDFSWEATEPRRGVYDFRRWEALLDACDKHHMRYMAVLSYSNPLYDKDRFAPHTPEAIDAFARWAVAAVNHFRGRGVMWEIWNEPNNVFWRPGPNVDAYIKLALATSKAIKAAAPQELVIGPALGGTGGDWLEPIYRAGLLEYWDAVTVHPYGNVPPEASEPHWRGSHALLERYRPKGRAIPLLSGEWGYTTTEQPPELQGKFLARQVLFNLSMNVPLSVWYDWRDDGLDPHNTENNFGVVANAYHADQRPPLKPKPAYLAAKAMTTQLDGFAFARRVRLAAREDVLLLFRKGDEVRGVAWTTSAKAHAATLPASAGVTFRAVDWTGEPLPDLRADERGLQLQLTDGPTYLVPATAPDALWSDRARGR